MSQCHKRLRIGCRGSDCTLSSYMIHEICPRSNIRVCTHNYQKGKRLLWPMAELGRLTAWYHSPSPLSSTAFHGSTPHIHTYIHIHTYNHAEPTHSRDMKRETIATRNKQEHLRIYIYIDTLFSSSERKDFGP